jgi:hypothetical protein
VTTYDPTKPVATIGKFFGKKDGASIKDLQVEIQALTDEDKRQLAEGIANGSMTY